VEGQHSITASNVAKYDALHSVVIFDGHNPLTLSEDQVVDAFSTARRWLEEAHRSRPQAMYPFVLWNCLPRSGASIVHAHLQVALAESSAYARVEMWRHAASLYRSQHNQNYFDRLYAAHKVIGLGGEHGGIRWLAHLTPMKDKELILLAPTMDGSLFREVYRMVRLYIDALSVRAYNVAIYLPPLGPVQDDWSDFGVIVRMVDRGNPSSATSDIGTMELFAQPVIAFDPWNLAAAVQDQG
jgi:hypothetical protein